MTNQVIAGNDSDDLEALFNSIIADNNESAADSAPFAESAECPPEDKVINKIGHMTRALHDSLRELGYEKNLERAASSIPDARDRLNYVVTMTKQAADRVLTATEAAQPVVEKMEVESQQLAREWQKLFDRQLDVNQFKNLAIQTHSFLNELPKQANATHGHLMEIMMAQDFQDLTGQVIKKIVEVTQQMEKQLLELLLENPPSTANPDSYAGLLNGPVINMGAGRTDVVTSQDQVDDLLESMGF